MLRLFVFCLLILPGICLAQTWPAKPLKMVVPFPPGGSNDIMGRMAAQQLGDRLGQQVVVENKGGAGGLVGTDSVAKAPPDGYTLLLISVAYAFNPALYKNLPFDPEKSFAPISMLGTGPVALTVYPGLPVNSVQELLALAKARPGKLNYASAGVGSLQHLASALFVSQAGVDIVHIPYKGGGPAMTDVIGGQADIVMPSLIQVLPHIKNGRLKVLGTSGTRRSPTLPDVPAIAEALPGYEAHNWWGILAPAGTPAPIVERLHKEVIAVLGSQETKKRLESEGAEPVRMTPPEFARFISTELVKWAKVARDAGIKAE
jgi:tripartite-type tricarboxylate transporter receptor subunit TctC